MPHAWTYWITDATHPEATDLEDLTSNQSRRLRKARESSTSLLTYPDPAGEAEKLEVGDSMKILLGLAVAAGTLVLSPAAHADTTLTVQQICSEAGGNLVPMTVIASPELSCGDPAYWASTGTVPGLFISAPPSISRTVQRLHQGAYSTDPVNPWADWIVPAGSQPAAPYVDPQIACDNIGPGGSMICNHDIWVNLPSNGIPH